MIDILAQHRSERKIALLLLVVMILVLLGVRGVVSGSSVSESVPVAVEAE